MKIFSIVGTDTEIGKTYTTVQILNYLNTHGFKAYALKPIAAGLDRINGQLINEDVFHISQANYSSIDEKTISPLQFKLAISPHIAAKYEQTQLSAQMVEDSVFKSIVNIKKSIDILSQKINANKNTSNNIVDYILIEGVGGVMVPLNETETYINVLQKLDQPVLLVVGMKLGCLNHALLTYNTLRSNNIKVIGWVANCIAANMPYLTENLEYLKQVLDIPLIAIIPHHKTMETTPIFKEIFACN